MDAMYWLYISTNRLDWFSRYKPGWTELYRKTYVKIQQDCFKWSTWILSTVNHLWTSTCKRLQKPGDWKDLITTPNPLNNQKQKNKQ